MINLIRSEYAKLAKSRALIICTIVVAIMSIIVVGSIKMLSTIYTDEMIQELENGYSDEVMSVSLTEELSMYTGDNTGMSILEQAFMGNTIQLLSAIFIAIFVASEFSNGTIKVIAAKGYSRLNIYIAKCISSVVAATWLAIVTCVVEVIAGSLLWRLGSQNALDVIKYLIVQLLINVALAIIFTTVTFVVKNIGAAIAINIVFLSFSSILVNVLDMIVELVIDKENVFNNIFIITKINTYSSYALSTKDVIYGILMAVIYGLVAITIGSTIFKKVDIK